MSDLVRMLDDGAEDAFLRDALDSSRDDVPDAARRAATLSALVAEPAKVNVTLPPTRPATSTGTAAASGGATLKWVVIIGLAAGALAIGLYAKSGGETGPDTNVPGAKPSVGSRESIPPAVPASAVEPAKTAADIPSAPPAASVSAPNPAPSTSVASGPALKVETVPKERAPLGLAEETAMLDRARSALTRGDARGALTELDTYDAAPAPKILGQEATMVRIEALSAKGDTTAARTLAKGFLAKNPGSTYDDRVRALIAEPKTP